MKKPSVVTDEEGKKDQTSYDLLLRKCMQIKVGLNLVISLTSGPIGSRKGTFFRKIVDIFLKEQKHLKIGRLTACFKWILRKGIYTDVTTIVDLFIS